MKQYHNRNNVKDLLLTNTVSQKDKKTARPQG